MSVRSVGKPRGARVGRPRTKVADLRRAGLYEPDFVARLWEQSAPQCLELGPAQHARPPRGLTTLEYRCDRPGLTGFAGMPALMKFAYSVGLSDRLGGLPIRKRDSVYSPSKLCEVVVAILAAGLERVAHVDEVSHDPGLCAALGLERLPDQATLSRFFGEVRPSQVRHLRQVNRAFSRQTVAPRARPRRLVVDGDTRVVGVYGKQEGAKASPRNGGDPQFTFEITTLRNSYDILDGGLLEGVTHPAPLFAQRFEAIVEQLGSETDEMIWCADAAWYAAHILQRIEAADEDETVPCACKYAIRAQIRGGLRQAIAALPEEAWRRCDADIQIAELSFAFRETRAGKDERARRYIVTRKRLPERGADSSQGVLVPQPRYEFGAIVTSLAWKPRQVWALYNQRATIETILKESALGFQMDHLPSGRFAGNELFSQLLILSYNLVNLFRRLCLSPEDARRHVQGLRRMVLAVPGFVERRRDGLILHCADVGPHVQRLRHILEALDRWLEPLRGWWTPAAAT